MIFAILLISCEKNVTGINLPYEEKLVIQGMLDPDNQIQRIKIERTLPALEIYSPAVANVQNAIAYIECEGKKIDLMPTDKNFYFAEYQVESGKKYTIHVKWKNLSASAYTNVPDFSNETLYDVVTKLDTVRDNYGRMIVKRNYKFKYTTDKKSCFKIISRDIYYGYEIGSPLFTANPNVINSFQFGVENINMLQKYVSVRKYDPQYIQYYNSAMNGRMSDDPFSTSGNNILGNIKGDGIGYFFSRADKLISLFD